MELCSTFIISDQNIQKFVNNEKIENNSCIYWKKINLYTIHRLLET